MADPYAQFADAPSGDPWAQFKDADNSNQPAKPAAPTAPAKPKRSLVENVTGAMANVNRGLGVGDELAAGANTIRDVVTGKSGPNLVQTFKDEMGAQRGRENAFSQAQPKTAALMRGVGMAGTAVIPAGGTANAFAQGGKFGLNAATAANAARGATTAGLTGAAYAAADAGTPAERLKAASGAARDPATLALGGALGATATPMRVKTPAQPAMSLDQLTSAKNAAYDAIDHSGITYKPEAVDKLITSVTTDLAGSSLNPARHPKAASMLADIQAMKGQSPTLTQVDQLRQVVRRDVANASDQADAYMGKRIINQIDAFTDATTAKDLAAGGGQDAASLLRNARDLNTRVRKVESVNDAVDTAALRAGRTSSGGNIDNATRQELSKVLTKTPNLTDEEASALTDIVMGGKGRNLLRLFGKTSPSGNGLMEAGHLAMLVPTHGLSGGVALAGAIAKIAADAATKSKVTRLIQLMARGGKAPAATSALASRVSGPAAARLAAGAGVARQVAPQNAFAQPANP